jgi:hypothetical protein
MDDHATLIGTAVLTVFFLIAGIINILDNPVIKGILFVGFIAIVASIIIAHSKKDDSKKNPPE